MLMPPFGPLRKDDGPACRVCGCTENNACVAEVHYAGRPPIRVACCWEKIDDFPRTRLCSACSGTAADMMWTINRGMRLLRYPSVKAAERAVAIGLAAKARYTARHNQMEENHGR
jgi:hypothetical protein